MRGVKKQDLPEKICLVCGRPFRWRKKWARTWDEVKYCSDRCRASARKIRSVDDYDKMRKHVEA